MKNNLIKYTHELFDEIKHFDDGNTFWFARELQKVLGYVEWRQFDLVIKKAIVACKNSDKEIIDHFVEIHKMVSIGSGATRKQIDYKLSKYACYLIMMEADSRKEIVALGKTYFAIKTITYEYLEDNLDELTEDEKRIIYRNRARKENLLLNKLAMKKGVKQYGRFTNKGYMGLYDGETADDIAKRKNLRYRAEILDYMGSEELDANIFRITQTEAALKRQEEVNGKKAGETHFSVGKEVREAIKRIGGTMPEDLPTPNKSIQEIEMLKDTKKES